MGCGISVGTSRTNDTHTPRLIEVPRRYLHYVDRVEVRRAQSQLPLEHVVRGAQGADVRHLEYLILCQLLASLRKQNPGAKNAAEYNKEAEEGGGEE